MFAQREALLHANFYANGEVWAAFGLIMLGAMTKSAQYPWHYWLPGAMAAPTPVSAFLHSATMVKAGVFLAGRLFPVFSALALWPWLILPIGAVTMILGALLAVNQHDLKRIFAYTTVSQLGLLMAMYGLGAFELHHHHEVLANLDWDITQIANHAFYKAPLFIIAGALGHVASRELPDLFGAFRKHKAMCIVMLLAGYALAAGPGTISFQAKEFFLYAVWHSQEAIGDWWIVLMAMTVITAACNMAIFVRLLTTLMGWRFGQRRPANHHAEHHHHHEHHVEPGLWGAMLWLPAAIIVAPQFVGGMAPHLWEMVFGHVETHTNYFAHIPTFWHAFAEPTLPLFMSMLSWALGLGLALSPWMRGAVVDVHDWIFPGLYRAAVDGGAAAFGVLQTGYLRDYIMFVLATFLLGFAGAVLVDWDMVTRVGEALPQTLEYWPGVLIGLLICLTSIALPLTQRRVLRVLLLGASGLAVVGMYLVYQAPDLALTQLTFEIISVLLFVLVLRLLPAPIPRPKPGRLQRLALAAIIGIAFGWLTLVVATPAPAPSSPTMGEFYAQHSYEGTELTNNRGGGGRNIVNVILVDFRGLDTLGEITVLTLAALGVWSLLPALKHNRYRHRRTGRKEVV